MEKLKPKKLTVKMILDYERTLEAEGFKPIHRFKSLEHWQRWQSGKEDSIPSHIKRGETIVPNPEYRDAHFENKYLFHPKAIKIGKVKCFKNKNQKA